MKHFHSYLRIATEILSAYSGNEPFASFIKKYFAARKKHGSRDRRLIAHLCYCYFRMGKAGLSIPTEKRIVIGLFLCSDASNEMLAALHPEWNEKAGLPLREKFDLPGDEQIAVEDVFPWSNELSEGVDAAGFSNSFFVQPDLFLRIRPGFHDKVLDSLKSREVSFSFIPPATLRLPNTFKVDDFFANGEEVVVQDLNSQNTGRFLPAHFSNVWDCCAASGGKSIMAFDKRTSLNLTVSDIRESIIQHLRKRFATAGIRHYKAMVIDLARSQARLPGSHEFDLIICDVPCSGSGTWSRTPEQLFYFDGNRKIDHYAGLQQKILSNVYPALKPGGHLLYITCSVFRRENEEAIGFLERKCNMTLIRKEILNGYDQKADTLFAALLVKSS
jgi:16S rRNA (cytosine967-C5)-methyltransferase